MAREIYTQQTSLSGSTLYATLDSGGLRWNGTAFEAVLLAHWSTYAVAMNEATGTGYFTADRPAGISAGTSLFATIYKRIGGSAAATDPVVASGTIEGAIPGLGICSAATSTSITLATTDPFFASTSLVGGRVEIVSGTSAGSIGIVTGSPGNGTLAIAGGWSGATPSAGAAYMTLPPGGSISGPVTLATSQPNYAPATTSALAGLITTVGTAGAGLTGVPYTGPSAGTVAGAVVAGMATSPVGSVTGTVASVTNLQGVALDGGTVVSGPLLTSLAFSLAGLPAGLATGDLNGMQCIFQGGNRAGVKRIVLTHVVVAGSPNRHDIVLTLAMGGAPALTDPALFC